MCHVLIIEDEWLIAAYIEDVARAAGGSSIDIADSEADAIAAAQRRTPEIILSDVNLRSGTGPRAVKAIMAACGPMPVIFITGTPEDCVLCDPSAVILGKPIKLASLTETFQRLAPV